MTHDPNVAHLLPEGIRTGVHPAEAFALEGLARDKVVLEFGSQLGFSTIVMGRVARLVVAVDWHLGDAHAGWQDTLGPFLHHWRQSEIQDRIIPVVGRFERVAPLLSVGVFDLGFLDGFHDYPSTYRDLYLMAPLVNTIAVHDYERDLGGEPFEVTPAVETFLSERREWRKVRLIGSLFVMARR